MKSLSDSPKDNPVPGPEPDPPPVKEPPNENPANPNAPVDEPDPVVPRHVYAESLILPDNPFHLVETGPAPSQTRQASLPMEGASSVALPPAA